MPICDAMVRAAAQGVTRMGNPRAGSESYMQSSRMALESAIAWLRSDAPEAVGTRETMFTAFWNTWALERGAANLVGANQAAIKSALAVLAGDV